LQYTGRTDYPHVAYGFFGDSTSVAGEVEPLLTEPIDYQAELTERARSREPLAPIDGELTNSDFGI